MMKLRRTIFILLFSLTCVSLGAQSTDGDPIDVENRLLSVTTKLFSGKISYENAIKTLNELRTLDPHNDAIPYYLSKCYFATRHYSDAETKIKEAINLSNGNNTYIEFLAEIYNESGRSEKAAAIYIGLLKEHPEKYSNPYTLTLLGEQMMEERKDSAAMATFDKALLYDPEYIPALLGKSEIYFFRKNYPAYFVIMNQFARTPYINTEAKTDYIRKSLTRFESADARMWLPQIDSIVVHCVEANPTDTTCLSFAGDWFYSTEREEQGCYYYDKMLSDNPESISAHFIKMQILLMKQDTLSAISEAKSICQLSKGNAIRESAALSNLGDFYYQMGDKPNAYKCYDKALKLNPENITVLNNYAYFLCLDNKNLGKAKKMSLKTIEMEPDNATFLDTYGWILHLQGKDKEAVPYFEHALIYGGRDNAEVLNHYADILEAIGENHKAQYYRNIAKTKK